MKGKIIILFLVFLFCFIGMNLSSVQDIIQNPNGAVTIVVPQEMDFYPAEIDQAYAVTPNFGQRRVCFDGHIDDLVVANIDNDKFADVAILDHSNKKVKILFGDSNFNFTRKYEKKFDDMYDLFAGAADFNTDNKIDLAVANDSNDKHLSIFLQKGNGQLKKPKDVSASDSSTWDFYFAKTLDFNGDGKPDILGLRGDDALIACRNVGRGKFKADVLKDKVGNDGLITGDFDGDGLDDFIVGDSIKDKIYFFQSKGKGGFKQTRSVNAKDLGYELYAADINQDGKLDLVGAGSSSGKAWTLFGKGTGNFRRHLTLKDSKYLRYGACIADFNGDKKPDIVGAESDGIYYYPAKGKGKFDKPSQMGGALNFSRNGYSSGQNNVGFGDFNNDNKPDIVGAQYYGSSYSPYCNLVFFQNGGTPATLTISNPIITYKNLLLNTITVRGSVDFSGSGIDLHYNPWWKICYDSTFLTINIDVGSWPFGYSVTYQTHKDFTYPAGAQSGTINFDFTITTSVVIIGNISVKVDWIYVTDYNLVKSNTLDIE